MIGAAIRTDIEAWAACRYERTFFRMARDGQLTPAMVARYLTNVTWSIRQNAGHLRDAHARSRELGDERLAQYFHEKIGEEAGHEEWGDRDLESFQQLVPTAPTVTPAISSLDKYIGEVIEEDPALFLVFLAFAEYITVLLGPELLDQIEGNCGVKRSSMTVIDNHIELDRDHAEENFGLLDDLISDPRRIRPLRDAMKRVLGFFDRFCEEVAQPDTARERHVSAA